MRGIIRFSRSVVSGGSVGFGIVVYGRIAWPTRSNPVLLRLADRTNRWAGEQLCGYVAAQYKPCIFVVNKWDLLHKQMPTERWVRYLRDSFQTMWHVPIAFVTGQTGKNMKMLLNHAQNLFKQSRQRVTTGQLNKLLRRAIEHHPPPLYRNYRPKVYYATQVGSQPPTIVMICNNPKAFSVQYRRYLLGVFRDQLTFGRWFTATSIHVICWWAARERLAA